VFSFQRPKWLGMLGARGRFYLFFGLTLRGPEVSRIAS
jgi:hypothetical protein